MASAPYLDHYLDSLKSLPVELQEIFTLIRNIDRITIEKIQHIDKLANDFMSNANDVLEEKNNKAITRIQRQFVKAKECCDDKINLAELSHKLVNRHIRQLDIVLARFSKEIHQSSSATQNKEKRNPKNNGIWLSNCTARELDLDSARFSEEIHDRASNAKNIEDGVQQIDGIWNKPSTSREEETTPSKLSKNKKIKKGVAKKKITAPSKTPLVSVIHPTNSTTDSVANVKVETGPLNGTLGSAEVAHSPKESDIPVDPNELTYCLCKQISYGRMIACDNPDCPIEWFHFGCVNVTTKPKGKWFCSKCKINKKKK